MSDTTIIVLLLSTHFVADFVCQTRDMGRKKSHSFYWLSMHVWAYTLALGACLAPFMTLGANLYQFILLNGLLHLVTDFFTSKASSHCYKRFEEDQDKWEYRFWLVIGFDQLVHAVTLVTTYEWLMR
jgi:hypothetical protein